MSNTKSCESAIAIVSELEELIELGYITVVPQDIPDGIHPDIVGPHENGGFEVWCPIEDFARIFLLFTLNRGKTLSSFIL